MKTLLAVFTLVLVATTSVQAQTKWLTNHKEAMSIAEAQNKHILVFASDDFDSEGIINDELFNSEAFKTIQSNFVFLQLNVTTDSYNKRLAAHYSGVKTYPVLALIDKKGNPLGKSLHVFTTDHIQKFITVLKANIKA